MEESAYEFVCSDDHFVSVDALTTCFEASHSQSVPATPEEVGVDAKSTGGRSRISDARQGISELP
jgi:hypothetical protein